MTIALATAQLRIVSEGNDMIADLDSIQGMWTVDQYLRLTDSSPLLIEFTDGELEVLPMPTEQHQAISQFLLFALHAFMQKIGGRIFYAPLRLQIREGKFREPDLLMVQDANDPRRGNAYWRGADLVVEIVSPDDLERDTKIKRGDYAEAQIPEYWIVNPEDASITVLQLAGDGYATHGVFHRGDTATSPLLAGFAVAVDAVLDAR
jgi:Uma2 family endonuclease